MMDTQQIKAAIQAHVDCDRAHETAEQREHLACCLKDLHKAVPDWRLLVLELISENEALRADLDMRKEQH